MARVREAFFEDLPAAARLAARYGMSLRDEPYWELLWKKNPSSDASGRVGWVIEKDDGGVGGFLGSIPLSFELDGAPVPAAAATTFVVDEGSRNLSLLLAKAFFSQKGPELLLVTTSNDSAGRLYAAFKAKRMPEASYGTPLFWVCGWRGFLAASARKLGWGALAPLTLPLGVLADACSGPARTGSVRLLDGFDPRFDAFWQELRARRPGRLLAVRDQRHLSWHYGRAAGEGRLRLLVLEESGRILGYAVLLRQDNEAIGLRRMVLADLQLLDELPEPIAGLIAAARALCRQEGSHVLEAVGFARAKRMALEALSPFKREFPSWPYYYKAGPALAGRLEDARAWDPCFYDGDSGL